MILRKYATTGDGLLTAIMLAERMVDAKMPLSRLAAPVVLSPQLQKSIRVPDKDAVLADPVVKARRRISLPVLGIPDASSCAGAAPSRSCA